MKKELLSFTIEQPKQRHHKMLFCEGTPFMPKIEKCKKKTYSRKQKHRKDNNDYWVST